MIKKATAKRKALLTESGFTLFELVAVVVIVGILVSPTRGRYELENGRWVYRSP